MSSQGEGLTATDARGQPSQVRRTLHVLLRSKLPLGDYCVGDRQGLRSVLIAFCTSVCGCHLFFTPIHDYILAIALNTHNIICCSSTKTAHFSLHHKLALKLKVLPSNKSYIAFKCPFMQIEHEIYLKQASD